MSKEISIVIVDDNEIDLMIGSRLISMVTPSIKVTTFLDGKELVSILNNQGCGCTSKNIFFIDIYMPNCNGFEVVDEIVKALEKTDSKADCYLLSASIDLDDLHRININSNIKGFIGKPITVDVIKNIIYEVEDEG